MQLWDFCCLFHSTCAEMMFCISGRKEIIEEFKALVSSFPERMGAMQGQLRKHKEGASDFHSLQADVQSLSSILDRKVCISALV